MAEPLPTRLQLFPGPEGPSAPTSANPPDPAAIPEASGGPSDAQLGKLRELLIGEERARLDVLATRLEEERVSAEKLGGMLPTAIRAAQTEGLEMAEALAPTITDAFRELVKEDPQSLVDAISPVMFPTIRAAIRDAIRGMVQSLNQALEASMSWQSLMWRWESLRTGRPFADIVLRNTLLYRVDQVFLIDRRTGLLLRHAARPQVNRPEPDVVSAMLTALQDFVKDSFHANPEDALSQVEIGDTTVWLEHGSHGTLAAVVVGHPPRELRETLQDVLRKIHHQWMSEWRTFKGDDRLFAGTEPLLEKCLVTATRPPQISPWARVIARWGTAAVCLGLVALLAWGAVAGWRARALAWRREIDTILQTPPDVSWRTDGREIRAKGRATREWLEFARGQGTRLPPGWRLDLEQVVDQDADWNAFVNQVAALPGVVITSSVRTSDGGELRGLKDPLADDPRTLAADFGLEPGAVKMTWTPYHDLAPRFVQRRALDALRLPPSVQSVTDDTTIRLTGSANHTWLDAARRISASLPPPTLIDLSAVIDSDLEELRGFVQEVRTMTIAIPMDGGVPRVDAARLVTLAQRLEEIRRRAAELNQTFRCTVVGDGTTSAIAKARAQSVAKQLVRLGVLRDCLLIADRRNLPAVEQRPAVDGCRFEPRVGLLDW